MKKSNYAVLLFFIFTIILVPAHGVRAELAARSGISINSGWTGFPSSVRNALKSTDTTMSLEGYTIGLGYVSYGSKGPRGVFSSRYTFTYDHYRSVPNTQDFTAGNADIFMFDVAEIVTIFPSWPVNLYTGIGMGWGIIRLYHWGMPTDPSVDPQKVRDLENKIGKYPLPFPTIYIPVGLNIRIKNFIFSAEAGVRDIPYLIGMFTYAFNKKNDVRIVKEVIHLPPPPPNTGKATGNVVDKGTSRPIGRAIIEMRNTGMTDLSTNPVNGTFTTPALKAGIVKLYASKEGYNPGYITATIRAGKVVLVTIALQKKSTVGAIYGKVTDLQGNPLSATIVAVSVQGVTAQTSLRATSDPITGKFLIKLQAGDYAISARLTGYETQTKNISVSKGFRTGVNFTMEAVKLTPPPTVVKKITVRKKIRVFIEKEKKKIVITEKIFFKLGKSNIMSVSFGILDELAGVLIKNPNINIRIEGYTDSTGRPATNLRLSQARANAVMKYLADKGVASDRMTAKGYGIASPIADNRTASGRAKNRRVEFVIVSQP